ncbi:MAG TPA: FMN-binding negative transcriptional regulator [Burkholderiaceae bacterium]|nr:FMN-binding negative transcriptional regulator [Burkholderiaceae bacterium]
MYLPAHFEESRPELLHALLRRHPLGLLVTQDAAGTLGADSVPFILDADPAGGPGILRAHVARANPVWREARGDVDALVVFQGPQAYISPAFYPSKAEHGKVVPTWNYVTVQARGRLRAIDDADWLRAFVTRLTERHETPRAQPWAVSDAPAEYIATMLHAIVGIEIVLTALTGKWKVSQNRSAADRAGVARGLGDMAFDFEACSAAPRASPAP